MLNNNDILLYEKLNNIAYLTLNRPQAQNALSTELLSRLFEELIKIEKNKDIKVIVIASNGKNFCSGHDLKELALDRSKERFNKIFKLCSKVMTKIVKTPKPVIASVKGTATAAGCQLVASCDLAIASKNSKFATPGVNIGLFCSTPMVAVSRNINKKQTMEMLLLGELISSYRAKNLGLINKIVDNKKLKNETIKMAKTIASKSSSTLAIGKEAFYKQLEMGLEDAYKYTSMVMTTNMLKKDAQEGINAFINHRNPKWDE
tara:strand:- start:4258 stop:5040 length:783 start_codon:yes stop_codon:yes gene_type:complete